MNLAWVSAWLLIVTFNGTNDAKVSVFNSKEECEKYKTVTEQTIGTNPNVKSIECMEGSVKENS